MTRMRLYRVTSPGSVLYVVAARGSRAKGLAHDFKGTPGWTDMVCRWLPAADVPPHTREDVFSPRNPHLPWWVQEWVCTKKHFWSRCACRICHPRTRTEFVYGSGGWTICARMGTQPVRGIGGGRFIPATGTGSYRPPAFVCHDAAVEAHWRSSHGN